MKCTENKSWEHHYKSACDTPGKLDIYFKERENYWLFTVYFKHMIICEKKCHQWHDEYYFTNFILNVLEFNSETNVDCEYID